MTALAAVLAAISWGWLIGLLVVVLLVVLIVRAL